MQTQAQPQFSTVADASESQEWLRIVRTRVSNLRFGTVQIVVHEGRVTQVDSTERTRLSASVSLAS